MNINKKLTLAEAFYKECANTNDETELYPIVLKFLKYNRIADILYKYPLQEYFELEEKLDSEQLTNKRKEAFNIFKTFKNYILQNLSQNERDMINIYKTFSTSAQFNYDIDEFKTSSIMNILDNACITIDTIYGSLIFEFVTRNDKEIPEDYILGFDDETKKIIIFVNDNQNIKRLEILNLFSNSWQYIHELTHYIDDINDSLNKYNQNISQEEYLNDPSEFKANLQMILGSFGRFLFKNNKLIDFTKLKDYDYIDYLFDIFLEKKIDINFKNTENKSTLKQFRICIFYLNKENKEEFYNQLHTYISEYYNTEKDTDFTEATIQKFIKLFRLEESFYKENK